MKKTFLIKAGIFSFFIGLFPAVSWHDQVTDGAHFFNNLRRSSLFFFSAEQSYGTNNIVRAPLEQVTLHWLQKSRTYQELYTFLHHQLLMHNCGVPFSENDFYEFLQAYSPPELPFTLSLSSLSSDNYLFSIIGLRPDNRLLPEVTEHKAFMFLYHHPTCGPLIQSIYAQGPYRSFNNQRILTRNELIAWGIRFVQKQSLNTQIAVVSALVASAETGTLVQEYKRLMRWVR